MNYEEYLLTHLIEECSEVIKAATKCQRFGKTYFWEKEGMTNREALAVEMGDVNFLVDKLRAIGWRFDSSKYDTGQRFDRALQISVKTGCVVLQHESQSVANTVIANGSQTNPAASLSSNDRAHRAIADQRPEWVDEPPAAPRASCEDCDD